MPVECGLKNFQAPEFHTQITLCDTITKEDLNKIIDYLSSINGLNIIRWNDEVSIGLLSLQLFSAPVWGELIKDKVCVYTIDRNCVDMPFKIFAFNKSILYNSFAYKSFLELHRHKALFSYNSALIDLNYFKPLSLDDLINKGNSLKEINNIWCKECQQ